jgi:hypothetical protein
MFTVSVEVQSTLPLPPQQPLSPSAAPVDIIMAAVFVVLVLLCLCVLLFIWRKKRRRRRPSSETGACSCLKYNLVEVANLYYYKVEEKQDDNLVKISPKT